MLPILVISLVYPSISRRMRTLFSQEPGIRFLPGGRGCPSSILPSIACSSSCVVCWLIHIFYRCDVWLRVQVSQTYFMALSTVFLACLARLFACNLHLGGRLLQVHGALLRTLLVRPRCFSCRVHVTLLSDLLDTNRGWLLWQQWPRS